MAELPIRPLTLLLAVLVAWAALTLIAAWGGLAGRYSLHPDDPTQVPALPALDLERGRATLPVLTDYDVLAARPLFNADRRPPPDESETVVDEQPPPPEPTTLDVTLTSVVMTQDLKVALVLENRTQKSQSVRLGNALEGDLAGWKLVELQPRMAVFEGPGGRAEAELRVFDGRGGQAPTPITAGGEAAPAVPGAEATADTPESRAEMIRRRIEERRRQMREEAARANQEEKQ